MDKLNKSHRDKITSFKHLTLIQHHVRTCGYLGGQGCVAVGLSSDDDLRKVALCNAQIVSVFFGVGVYVQSYLQQANMLDAATNNM